MPGSEERALVLAIVEGMEERIGGASDVDKERLRKQLAESESDAPMLELIIQERCKQKATSSLAKYNCPGGPEKLKEIVMKFMDDDEIGPKIRKFRERQEAEGKSSHK